MQKIFPALATLIASTSFSQLAVANESTAPQSDQWGVVMGLRTSNSVFADGESRSSDVFPSFYYEGDHFYLRGDYGGLKLWHGENAGVDAVARYRFFDLPEDVYGDALRGGAAFMGLQAYYQLNDIAQLQFDVLSDPDGRLLSELRLTGSYAAGDWLLTPEATLTFTGEKFNSRYYGLNQQDLDRGLEAAVSLKGRKHLYKNWHLEAKTELSWLGSEANNSRFVDENLKYELYLGLGMFGDKVKPQKGNARPLNAKPYWRVAQAWGTASDLQNMIFGERKTDPGADVRSTSIFYGHPLSDTLFGRPIEMYLTTGFVKHYSSDVQDASFEFVLGVKGYYTFDLPWRLRLGVAEGVSYADSLTYYEAAELQEKEFSESKLLNYLDVTLDVNVGDIVKRDSLKDLWLGTGIHHRSGIYGTSSAFKGISGGSNFSTVYLQWHGDF